MVYLRFPSFKTGINPSARSRIDINNLTGQQKLLLISSRIFGFNIGGNQRSGNRALRKPLYIPKTEHRYQLPLNKVSHLYPFVSDVVDQARKAKLLEERKMRILMRGIKIGKKKGGQKISLMNIFEKSKKAIEEKKE